MADTHAKKNTVMDVEGVIEPINDKTKEVSSVEAEEKPKNRNDKFAMPANYENRFLISKNAKNQELFRSHNDKHPAIIDHGDSLRTRNADRGTAMDMVELAAHRGWNSLSVKGPEEFRQEMWIEASSRGMDVKGYRPNAKDKAEAMRRSDMVEDRVIDRLDDKYKQKSGINVSSSEQNSGNKPDNIVEIPNYKKGVTGKIEEIGTAPYRDKEGATKTPFVAMKLKDGSSHKIWGVGIPDMIKKNDLKVGDRATVYSAGSKPVTIEVKDKETGKVVEKTVNRRDWDAKDIERNKTIEKKADDIDLIDRADKFDKQGKEKPVSVSATDTLAGKIKTPEAAKDRELKGMASKLSMMERDMQLAGVPKREIDISKENAAKAMAMNHMKGEKYPVERLANTAQKEASKGIQNSRNKGTIAPEKMSNPIEREKAAEQQRGGRSR